METPYGEIPDKFVPDMRPQEMHDYLRKRYGRRTVLKGAALTSALAAAGPVFWRQSTSWASTASAPQWISYGPDPTTTMYVNWATGAYNSATKPTNPQVQHGLSSSYGTTIAASTGQVPVPSGYTLNSGDTDDTFYSNVLLTGLTPGTTYHYSVSNDGVNWSSDVTFTTGYSSPTTPWTFGVTGDEATSSSSTSPIAQVLANMDPTFVIIAGDLSYASGGVVLPAGGGSQPSYSPSAWDSYLGIVGPTVAQSTPWMAGVGNHEMEPLTYDGYAGFVTRFPGAYDLTSGSPVVRSFTYGNVAFLMLDGNDLSAEITPNNGYTAGQQTTWLTNKLAAYRAAGSGVDFIVVSFHNCMFCSNQTHGSDAGIRNIWQSIFDTYNVDLVVNGHVHAYERAHPIKGTTMTPAPTGSTITPATEGTTYICAGGGGQSLYTTWYGTTTAGDAGSSGSPFVDYWTGGDTSKGGSGSAGTENDPWLAAAGVSSYSAYRHANWSCLQITVTPAIAGGTTTMQVNALDPTQTSSKVTSTASPAIMDTVTLSRTAGPPAVTPEVSSTDMLVVAGGAVLGAGAYLAHRSAERERILLPSARQPMN